MSMEYRNIISLFLSFLLVLNTAFAWKIFGNAPDYFKTCKTSNLIINCFQKSIKKIQPGTLIKPRILNVNLMMNSIQRLEEKSFKGGINLRQLKLSYNEISYIGNKSFEKFVNLNLLFIDHNKLNNLELESLKGLGNLQSLYIGFNGIMNLDSRVFLPLKKLEVLSLKGNPFNVLTYDDPLLQYLPNILSLDISRLKIKKLPKNFFKNSTRLQKLILANNNFTDLPTEPINDLVTLQSLDISINPIKKLPQRAFFSLENLEVLIMDNMNELMFIQQGVFDGLFNLKTLFCSYNYKLNMIHRWAFSGERPARNIKEVALRSNALRRLHSDSLNWFDLDILDLRNNPWNCDCDISWMPHLVLSERLRIHFTCASPKRLMGMAITSADPKIFICKDNTSYMTVIGVTFVIAMLFIVTITVFVVVYFKCNLCSKLRAYNQRDYRIFSNTKTVHIEADGKDFDQRTEVVYGASEIDLNNSDEEECYNRKINDGKE